MKSQMASPSFSPVYAALVAVINTKFPEIGELLLNRIVLQVSVCYATPHTLRKRENNLVPLHVHLLLLYNQSLTHACMSAHIISSSSTLTLLAVQACLQAQ